MKNLRNAVAPPDSVLRPLEGFTFLYRHFDSEQHYNMAPLTPLQKNMNLGVSKHHLATCSGCEIKRSVPLGPCERCYGNAQLPNSAMDSILVDEVESCVGI